MVRKKYDLLLKWKEKANKPLILLGVRQSGKTTLLKDFGKNEFKGVHYFNFEENPKLRGLFKSSLDSKKIIGQLELLQEVRIDSEDLIIFDEIQACPEALTSLKYFAETKNYFLIAAGSLLGVSLTDVSFPVGKVQFERLYPLGFSEFLKIRNSFLFEQYSKSQLADLNGVLHEKLLEEFKLYQFTGGMPEVVHSIENVKELNIENYNQIRQIQNDLVDGYFSDFAKHSGKLNSLALSSVWSECAKQMGETKDGSVRRFRFQKALAGKKQFSQFENFFHWLEKANLILKSSIIDRPEEPLESFTKNSLFKCYIFDIGILNAMLKIPVQSILTESIGFYRGFMVENFVAQELAALNYKFYTWQGKQSEVEFVINHNGNLIPIEVKSGTRTKSKSLLVYSDFYNPKEKLILSQNPYKKSGNLHKVPIYAIEKTLQLLK